MVETIFYWMFLIVCIFAFWFGFGIIENWIRKWTRNRQDSKQQPTPRIIDNSPDPSGKGHSDYVLH